jgi:hypothetical protein
MRAEKRPLAQSQRPFFSTVPRAAVT